MSDSAANKNQCIWDRNHWLAEKLIAQVKARGYIYFFVLFTQVGKLDLPTGWGSYENGSSQAQTWHRLCIKHMILCQLCPHYPCLNEPHLYLYPLSGCGELIH